jgi:hypothetical protein
MARCFSAKKSKAGKSIECGRCEAPIVPGELYYFFSVGFRGSKRYRCKLHRPKQSELCGSKLSGVYAAIEDVEEVLTTATTPEEIAEALESAASDVESVRDEYQESYDNLGDNFQNGQPGDDIQEKIDACEEFAQTLSDAADEVRNIDTSATDDEDADTDDDHADPEEDKYVALIEARDKAEEAISGFSL